MPIARRVGMFEEGITLMRRLWTEPEVTFQGGIFRFSRCGWVYVLQQPGVPLWLAGRRIRRSGGSYAWEMAWLPISSSPQAFTADWERLQVLGQEMGRDAHDLHRCLYTTLNVNADVAQAERELRAFIESYYGIPYEVQATGTVCARARRNTASLGSRRLLLRGTDYRGSLRQSRSDGTTSAVRREVLPHVRPVGWRRRKSMPYPAVTF